MPGCCGEPAGQKLANNTRVSQYPQSPVSQQPAPQPGLQWQEKNDYLPPHIPSPSPSHSPYGLSNSPPPQSQYNGYTPANTSTLYESTLNGHAFSTSGSPPPLLRPNPVHAMGSQPPGLYNGMAMGNKITSVTPATAQNGYAPASDEGKLSVSIDFGMIHSSNNSHSD